MTQRLDEALPSEEHRGVSGLFVLPADAIVEVLLGPRMDAKTRRRVVRALDDPSFESVRLREVTAGVTSYNLVINEIADTEE